MNYLPLIALLLLVVVFIAWTGRARRRQALAEAERSERIGVGSDVMTTSGLHGTVVARNDDGTVALSIAPGVEVRWELAALRDQASLPPQYRHEDEVDEAGSAGRIDLQKGEAPNRADPGT